MTTAATRLLAALLPPQIGVKPAAPPDPDVSREGKAAMIVVRRAEVVGELLGSPSIERFAEAFVSGDIDVEGDLLAAVAALYELEAALAPRGQPERSGATRPADEDAVRYHYDRSNEFFALFLDHRLVYSCAYFTGPEATLDQAQEAKLDLVCRKLRLGPADELLDVGCGFGGLTAHAAARYGARVLGVTLSEEQAAHGCAMLLAEGLGEQARIERRHWREVTQRPCFDKVAAVGIIEHVGVESYPLFFGTMCAALRPGGLLLNHGITHATPGRYSSGMRFLTREVFPGAEFERVSRIACAIEDAGFEILDVEALGGHYAETTARWLARLEASADRAVALVGERTYRTWLGYLAAASVAFRAGWIDLHQIVARRPDPSVPRRPGLRPGPLA